MAHLEEGQISCVIKLLSLRRLVDSNHSSIINLHINSKYCFFIFPDYIWKVKGNKITKHSVASSIQRWPTLTLGDFQERLKARNSVYPKQETDPLIPSGWMMEAVSRVKVLPLDHETEIVPSEHKQSATKNLELGVAFQTFLVLCFVRHSYQL